ncbi:hypothetical protein PTKIN_Ptkin16aG0068500 [Pterospermum kingtungense]
MSSSDNPVETFILIQNNTGVDAKKTDYKNFAGQGQPPEMIPDKGSGKFTQTVKPDDSSIGGVVYEGILGYQFIFAWSNKPVVKNQAYATILNPGDKYDWEEIKKRLSQSSNTSSDTVATYSSIAVIDATGGSPTFTAQLKGQ